MVTSTSQKILELKGNVLHILGIEGHVNRQGMWVSRNSLTKQESTCDPNPVSPTIEAVIEDCFFDRREDEIEYIVVSRRTLIRLYMENKITKRHISNAKLGKNVILFEDIPFCARNGIRLYAVIARRVSKDQPKIMMVDAHLKPIAGKDLTSASISAQ
jgi:hypothetical protein